VQINKVGVVGCGLMGSGICQVCAEAGYEVLVYDLTQELINKGLARVKKVLSRMTARGEISERDVHNIVRRINYTTELRDFHDRDLIIEAIIEKIEPKRQLFSRLDEICNESAIFASNTSSLSIIDMAAATKRVEKVLGIHFIAPPTLFRVVEIVRSVATSDIVIDSARKFCESLGMSVFVTQDFPGFVMNNIQIPMLLQAVRILERGLATKEEIDLVMTKGMGHRIGPLALLDYVGLDVVLSMSQNIYEETKDMVWAPPLLLKKMVAAGWLGRKTGRGFYEYAKES